MAVKPNSVNSTSVAVTNVTPGVRAAFTRVGPDLEATVQRINDIKAGPIKLGTIAGTFRESKKLKLAHPDRRAAETAFKALKSRIQGITGYTDIVTMTVDCDNCMITLTRETGEKVTLTGGELKQALMGPNPTPAIVAAVEEEVIGYFNKFDEAFFRSGISTISHYSPKGADTFESRAGGEALQINRYTPAIIHNQESIDLVSDAAKKNHGILSLLGHSHVPEEAKKKAVDKALRAEAFLLHLRDSLTQTIDKLRFEMVNERNQANQNKLNKSIKEYVRLRDQLNDTNRRALWVNAIYSDPTECYGRMLNDYYEECYAHITDPLQKPSFEQFVESANSVPFRQRAAETASLLITDPKEYRLFCAQHQIEPRKHHVNRFLNAALALKPTDDPATIDLRNLGFSLTKGEREVLNKHIKQALDTANSLEAKVDQIAKSQATAEARLKTAAKAKELFPHLKDMRNPDNAPGFFRRTFTTIKSPNLMPMSREDARKAIVDSEERKSSI